jgi:hypothetical protein
MTPLSNTLSRPLLYSTAENEFAGISPSSHVTSGGNQGQVVAGAQVAVALDISHLRPYALIRSEKSNNEAQEKP